MKSWRRWLVALALIACASYIFLPLVGTALQAGVGLVTAGIYLAAYLFLIVVPPLGALWLCRFVYSVFLRSWFRAWRINRIRNARALKEVLERDQGHDS